MAAQNNGMDHHVDLVLEQIGRDAAAAVAGAENVEAVEAREIDDWTEKPAYFFSFLIEQDRDRLGPGLLRTRVAQRLRDELIARGDYRYPLVQIINRGDWDKYRRV
jgi:hypothetical protein